MAEHLLDRAAWHALTTRMAHVAQGDARAVRMHPDYGQFSAPQDFGAENLAALAALIPPGGMVRVAPDGPFTPPLGICIAEEIVCHQMLAEQLPAAPDIPVTPLGEEDAEEMLALATLTEPGPYFRRTHQLGDFVGVRVGGKLVAMAGERLKLDGYTEISAVCTHPDYRRLGLAGSLIRVLASKIRARGETTFLHVVSEKKHEIAFYQRLGFRFRREIRITMLKRG